MKSSKQKPSVAEEFQLLHDLVTAQVLTKIALHHERAVEQEAHHQSDDNSLEVIAEAHSDAPEEAPNPFAFYFKLSRLFRQLFASRS